VTWRHHVWDQGVVLRPVRLVTIATAEGELSAGWLPADVAGLPNDLVWIDRRIFTVLEIGAPCPHPTNGLPRWLLARPWIDPADLYDAEDAPCG
jgi:hypothetical protein